MAIPCHIETGLNSKVVFVATLTTHLPRVKKNVSVVGTEALKKIIRNRDHHFEQDA